MTKFTLKNPSKLGKKKFAEMKVGEVFISEDELWVKTEEKDETWFYEPDKKYYHYINSFCLNDGVFGITLDNNTYYVVVKEMEYTI